MPEPYQEGQLLVRIGAKLKQLAALRAENAKLMALNQAHNEHAERVRRAALPLLVLLLDIEPPGPAWSALQAEAMALRSVLDPPPAGAADATRLPETEG